jgi:tryptophanyl-tRNA synthetase
VFGREPDFEAKAERAVKNLGSRNAAVYRDLRKSYQEQGNADVLAQAHALLDGNSRLTLADRERLLGYLEGTGRTILHEPEALLTATPRVTGLDGRKMSKSYGNTIGLREDPDEVAKKLKTMQTDPARVRRTDPGDPEKCPVWDLHKLYSSPETQQWVQQGCRTAGIGCLECKKPVIEVVVQEITGMRQRAQEYEDNPDLVRGIIAEGNEKARAVASQTLDDVRQAMGLAYR